MRLTSHFLDFFPTLGANATNEFDLKPLTHFKLASCCNESKRTLLRGCHEFHMFGSLSKSECLSSSFSMDEMGATSIRGIVTRERSQVLALSGLDILILASHHPAT